MGSKNQEMPDSETPEMSQNRSILSFPKDTESCPITKDAAPTFDVELRAALKAERIAAARTLVANAEVILSAHVIGDTQTSSVTRSDIAAAKARIAMATGDGDAAHAILVQAIEVAPNVAALRTLMTEVMLASGRAADARPVLQHLGQAPSPQEAHQRQRDKMQDSSQ